ncbi:MAG: hypothetical protein ABSB13_04000 [Candidatus Binatus sp.]
MAVAVAVGVEVAVAVAVAVGVGVGVAVRVAVAVGVGVCVAVAVAVGVAVWVAVAVRVGDAEVVGVAVAVGVCLCVAGPQLAQGSHAWISKEKSAPSMQIAVKVALWRISVRLFPDIFLQLKDAPARQTPSHEMNTSLSASTAQPATNPAMIARIT